MNDKNIMLDKNAEQETFVRVSHRKVWSGLLAVVICLVLAALVWVGVMNTKDTDYIPIRVEAPEGYTCTLSVEGVEVKGAVGTLRGLKEINVTLSAEDAAYIVYYYEGEAVVNEAFLQLPADVQLVDEWNAVLSVTAKK